MASHSVFAQAILPTGGNVVAGTATISQSANAVNIQQSSNRAIINWNSFNVGANAQVNFNQPNSSAVTLNRVTGATPSQIDGVIRANGQVIFSNPNGITFGKGAQVDAGAVIATTMDISNKDFMDGKSTFKGNGKGAILNEGRIQSSEINGYVALLAPEVRNQGVIIAKGGGTSTVALASGSQITLNFSGNQLLSVKVDAAVYRGLIENKRVIEAPGGLVIIAANSLGQLMGSVVQNSGKISTTSMVSRGGSIEIVASEVTNSGVIAANSKAPEGSGGTIAIRGDTITLAETSRIKANAKNQGDGGKITLIANDGATVAGVISAKGGREGGNGGFIETSATNRLVISQNAQVSTKAPKGKTGTWLLDPQDLLIDANAANAISAALVNNNVTVEVSKDTCFGGLCSQNGTGSITLAANASIYKLGPTPTSLLIRADGTYYQYGTISSAADSSFTVSIAAQDRVLAAGSSISANQVSLAARNSILAYGQIIGYGSNPIINVLANIFQFYGAITANSSSGNGGVIRIAANSLVLSPNSKLEANGSVDCG